ncbi:MAG: BON domain-containing protein [Pirellulales bacterium]
MRVSWMLLLGTGLVVGCADRDTTARRDIIPAPSVPAPATPPTGAPRTTADQAVPGESGSFSNQGRVETRLEQRVSKPVLEDSETAVDPENTRINQRDADTALTKTPRDQGQGAEDIETTAAIRKRVVDMDLSTNAENVKIITADGKVTLRGVVESDEEKQTIERIARELAGEGDVESQLIVDRD